MVIVIVKKFDFEILTYIYVLRSIEFIYDIFKGMYVCMCLCVFVFVCVLRVKIVYTIELKVVVYVTDHRLANLIDLSECWMYIYTYIFFTKVQKRILIYYGLWNQII